MNVFEFSAPKKISSLSMVAEGGIFVRKAKATGMWRTPLPPRTEAYNVKDTTAS